MDELEKSFANIQLFFQNMLHSTTLQESNFFKRENTFPLELNQKECCELLCGKMDSSTFQKRFLKHDDFPRIKGKRDKFPRDEVVEWYKQNWRRTGV